MYVLMRMHLVTVSSKTESTNRRTLLYQPQSFWTRLQHTYSCLMTLNNRLQLKGILQSKTLYLIHFNSCSLSDDVTNVDLDSTATRSSHAFHQVSTQWPILCTSFFYQHTVLYLNKTKDKIQVANIKHSEMTSLSLLRQLRRAHGKGDDEQVL